MNTPSPLLPQGTQPPRGKSSLYFKVLMILTVHVVLIGGMLLQGCKDTNKEATKDPAISQTPSDTAPPPTNVASSTEPLVSPATLSNQTVATMPTTAPLQPTLAPATTIPAPATTIAPVTQTSSTPAMGDGREYVIAQGDTMGAIAKKNSVSLKALLDANPGVNPKKLQIGHKLQIPAGAAAVASTTPASKGAESAAAVEAPTGDGTSYTVKSGDTLGKIARAHGTSYKKIMAMNDLKTTAIRVGQKLKMPAPKPAGTENTPAAASIAPASATAPGPVSAVSAPPTGVAN